MKFSDRLSSLFFLGFSLFVCFSSLEIRDGSITIPNHMVFPGLVGLFLLAMSIVLWVQSKSSSVSSSCELFFKGETLKILYFSVTFSLCAFLLEPVGFVISILAFIVLLLKGIGGKPLGRSVVYGLIISLSTYLFFTYLLGARLPRGVLTFL